MKNLICMFMIVMTVTIWFKYDKNIGAKQSVTVNKVKFATDGAGVLFCLDKSCGKGNMGWDGFIPYESMIFMQENVDPKKFEEEEESKY